MSLVRTDHLTDYGWFVAGDSRVVVHDLDSIDVDGVSVDAARELAAGLLAAAGLGRLVL